MDPVRSLRAMLLASFTVFGIWAQSDNTSVNGTVKDPTGAAIPSAKITLKNDNTGATRETASSAAGTYVIPSIPSGTYTLTVEVQGFKKFESKSNKVDANLPATIDATMQVGGVSETVTVEASASAIQTETSALGKLVEGKQLSDLQLNGRNPIFLSLLKPGVRGGSLAGFSFDLNSGGFNINGSRSQDNLITFDGAVGVRTRSNGTSIGTADLDAVQEVQIMTANYSAEYGRAGGGQIRIVTKTGGQQFHGSAYEYLRNSALDANSWSNNRTGTPIQSSKFNQFGWNFNGPIYIPGKWNADKNKLFFFVGQEWVKRRRVDSNFRIVPTQKMKQGDFSELLGQNSFFSSPRIIRDSSGIPYENNIIPQSQLSANGLGLLKVFPDPNLAVPNGANNWYGFAGASTNQRKDTYSVDWLPTQNDQVKFRASVYTYFDENPFQTNFLISAREFDRPNQTASVNWTHTFNPTTVNETLITASRDRVNIRMQNTPAYDRATYGINYQYLYSAKDLPTKLPAFDATGFSTYTGSPYPSNSSGPIYVFSNNTTKIVNTHTIKFGVLLERAGQNDYDQINVQGVPGGTDNQNGRFVFTDTTPGGTGLAIANAARGMFSTYAEIGQRSYTPYRGHMFESFINDSWKATDRLKIELGVRYTLIQPYYSLWRNMAVFDPRFYDPAKAVQVNSSNGNPIVVPGSDPYNGVVFPGGGYPISAIGRIPYATTGEFDYLFRGVDKSYSQMQKNLFQPRVGIAYQIGSSGKRVIRAGIGRFSTRIGVSDSIFLGGNPPLQPLASIPNGRVDNPSGGSLSSFPLSVNTQDPIFRNPEAWNWNATFETEIGNRTNLEVSYVGRRGLRLQRERNINQLQPGTLQANQGVNENALRPYKGFGPIRLTNNEANSMYHGFQIGVNRRFASGFSYGFAYTLSKSEDDGSTQRTILPNAYDAHYLWGPSNFDTRHVAVANFIYELPFLKNSSNGFMKTVLGGWQVSGVAQFQSGIPFSVRNGDTDYAGVGSGSGNSGEGVAQFWKYTADPSYPREFGSGSQWLTVRDSNGGALFTQPDPGTFFTGSVRNKFYGPGFQNWNISAFKNFRFNDRVNLQFRIDGFNFINHPNWGATGGTGITTTAGIGMNPTASDFGQVTTKGGERNLQLGLRLSF